MPNSFPALLEGQKLAKKAAKVGFDWENAEQVFDKLDEEIGELKTAISEETIDEIGSEIGDILFVVLNLARKLEIDAETALKKTNRKFRQRFAFIEKELKENGKSLEKTSLQEMDDLWNKAKSLQL